MLLSDVSSVQVMSYFIGMCCRLLIPRQHRMLQLVMVWLRLQCSWLSLASLLSILSQELHHVHLQVTSLLSSTAMSQSRNALSQLSRRVCHQMATHVRSREICRVTWSRQVTLLMHQATTSRPPCHQNRPLHLTGKEFFTAAAAVSFVNGVLC